MQIASRNVTDENRKEAILKKLWCRKICSAKHETHRARKAADAMTLSNRKRLSERSLLAASYLSFSAFKDRF